MSGGSKVHYTREFDTYEEAILAMQRAPSIKKDPTAFIQTRDVTEWK